MEMRWYLHAAAALSRFEDPLYHVRFQILTAASMKFGVFSDVALCSHVEIDLRFRGAYCLHHQISDDGGSTHL
jgi:hypothetical protein